MAYDPVGWVKNRQLTGTAPVVKWAMGIRLKKATELQKMGLRVVALAMRPHMKEGDLEALNCHSRRQMLQLVNSVAVSAISATEAAWWVAHRDEPIHSWIAPAWERCLEHFTKVQPWK